jgi:hypothetical protein
MPLFAALVVLSPAFSMANPEAAQTGGQPKNGAAAKQQEAKPAVKPAAKPEAKPTAKPAGEPAGKPADKPDAPPAEEVEDAPDAAAAENAEAAAVALPVNPEPVRVYGWREDVLIEGVKEKLLAKLDTGALTSSVHAEEKELFERDGKKWVRFIITDPRSKNAVKTRIEAPLVRIARIKEPNAEATTREVVRLSFQMGERKLRSEFTLNNRTNMLAPVLIGRSTLKDLGWVDSSRTHLADQKILR